MIPTGWNLHHLKETKIRSSRETWRTLQTTDSPHVHHSWAHPMWPTQLFPKPQFIYLKALITHMMLISGDVSEKQIRNVYKAISDYLKLHYKVQYWIIHTHIHTNANTHTHLNNQVVCLCHYVSFERNMLQKLC